MNPLSRTARRRRQTAPEFIQTTFDMGFHRSQGGSGRFGRLAVRKSRAVAERYADAFGGGKALQRLVEVDPQRRLSLAPGQQLHGLALVRQRALLAPPLDVKARGDLL